MSNIEQRIINKDNSEFLRNPYQEFRCPHFRDENFQEKLRCTRFGLPFALGTHGFFHVHDAPQGQRGDR